MVMAVYILSSVSLDIPQCVVVRAYSIFVVFFVLSVVFRMCFENVYLGHNAKPNIFVIVRGICVVYSFVSVIVSVLLKALLGVEEIALFVILKSLELDYFVWSS